MNLKGMLLNIPPFFIHTQRTERCVKLVTEAARSVIGEEKRNSMKPSQVQNRQKMPSFKSKNILELHWKARINVYRHKVCMISKSFKQTLNYHYVRVAGITYTFSQSCQFSTEYQIFGV